MTNMLINLKFFSPKSVRLYYVCGFIFTLMYLSYLLISCARNENRASTEYRVMGNAITDGEISYQPFDGGLNMCIIERSTGTILVPAPIKRLVINNETGFWGECGFQSEKPYYFNVYWEKKRHETKIQWFNSEFFSSKIEPPWIGE